MLRSKAGWWLFVLALLLAAGVGGWSALRKSTPRPPVTPVTLHDRFLTQLDCTINGLDPRQTPITLAARERFLLDVAYTRQPAPGESYDDVLLLLVSDGGGPHGQIEVQSYLGHLKSEERRTPSGGLEWRSPRNKGEAGTRRSFHVPPGRYELRLCWRRHPGTVALLALEYEDPFRFLFPFYRAEIEITPAVPRSAGTP